MEGYPASSYLPLQTGEHLPLQARKGPTPQHTAAGWLTCTTGSVRIPEHGTATERRGQPGHESGEPCKNSETPGVLLAGGQPSDWIDRRGREERRRKKHLTCQILLAVPSTRPVENVNCRCFSRVTLSPAVTAQDGWRGSGVLCEYEVHL